MRYLKKFNESNSDLYTEISEDVYTDEYGINLPKNIIHLLDINDTYEISENNKFGNNEIDGTEFNGLTISDNNLNEIHIYYSEDEWFYVGMSMSSVDIYYKCDRIEGLISLLKDENIIK